jgi:predicted nuclease with TOPRIM domain
MEKSNKKQNIEEHVDVDVIEEGALEQDVDVGDMEDLGVAEGETSDGVRGAVVGESVTGRPKKGRGVKRQRIGGAGPQLSGEDDDELDPSELVPTLRPRGRPPTTGQYVGLAKAKAALNAAVQEERRLADEKEIMEVSKRVRDRSTRPLNKANGDALASELRGRVCDNADLINTIAVKSKSLKGTCVRDLKESAEAIKRDVSELAKRSQSEENQKLQSANERLQAELVIVRREFEELREEVRRQRLQVAQPVAANEGPVEAPSSILSIMESFKSELVVLVGEVVNARIDARLAAFSVPAVRPSLASDMAAGGVSAGSLRMTTGPSKGASVAPRVKAGKKGPKGAASRRKRAKRVTLAAREAARAREGAPAVLVQQTPTQVVYAKALGRKAKGSDKASGIPNVAPVPRTKLRPPRTAAVTLTLKPEAIEKGVKYETVLTEAKRRIKLTEVGLQQVRFRATATGARMLEIPPGTEDADKVADALAEKLRSVLDADVVTIQRPTKCVDIRVTGLDDSVVAEEVAAAVAAEGGCAVDAVRAGAVARSPNGSGSLLVSCPVVAAKKLVEAGRLTVGWISARVVLLEAKPLRCFKCLEQGHVAVKCDRGVDRSKDCFRCGQGGHKARECSADVHCVACAKLGKPAAHYIGRRGCLSGQAFKAAQAAVGGKKAVGGPVASQSLQHVAEEDGMDTAQ